jgi:hypothetical protein
MIASVFVVPDLTIGLAQERKGRGGAILTAGVLRD